MFFTMIATKGEHAKKHNNKKTFMYVRHSVFNCVETLFEVILSFLVIMTEVAQYYSHAYGYAEYFDFNVIWRDDEHDQAFRNEGLEKNSIIPCLVLMYGYLWMDHYCFEILEKYYEEIL